MFKQPLVRRSLLASLVGAIALAAASTATAANVTATATVTAGTLSLSTSATPSVSATLDGTDKTPNYTLPMTVNDATGSGTGWNVTITSTTFTTTAPVHTLSTSASTVTGTTATCAGGTTCTNPTNSITYPLAVPAAGTAPTAVKLFNAAANTGMGNFTVTPTVQVAIPANTYAGTYQSTVTVAVVSGP
jgi:WxL domain surface cell wall-binding